jgi:hypothetical protein
MSAVSTREEGGQKTKNSSTTRLTQLRRRVSRYMERPSKANTQHLRAKASLARRKPTRGLNTKNAQHTEISGKQTPAARPRIKNLLYEICEYIWMRRESATRNESAGLFRRCIDPPRGAANFLFAMEARTICVSLLSSAYILLLKKCRINR